MFKNNKRHHQPVLICSVNELPEEQREYLNTSWVGVFYREFVSSSVDWTKNPLRCCIPVASGGEKRTRKQARDSFWAFIRTSLAALCGMATPKMAAVDC